MIPYTVNQIGRHRIRIILLRSDFESFHGSNRNVTYNNWFASVPLAERMKSSPIKCSMIDMSTENKKEIPVNFKITFDVGQSKFLYHGEKNVNFIPPPPPKEILLLLFTLHKTSKINKTTNKPEIIMYYNKIKGGLDTLISCVTSIQRAV